MMKMTSERYLKTMLVLGKIKGLDFINDKLLRSLYESELDIKESFDDLVLENGLDLKTYLSLLYRIKYDKDALEKIIGFRDLIAKYFTKGMGTTRLKRLNEALWREKDYNNAILENVLKRSRILTRTPVKIQLGDGIEYTGINCISRGIEIAHIKLRDKNCRDSVIDDIALINFNKGKGNLIYLEEELRSRKDYIAFRVEYLVNKLNSNELDLGVTVCKEKDLERLTSEINKNL